MDGAAGGAADRENYGNRVGRLRRRSPVTHERGRNNMISEAAANNQRGRKAKSLLLAAQSIMMIAATAWLREAGAQRAAAVTVRLMCTAKRADAGTLEQW